MRHRVFRQRSTGRYFEPVMTVSAGRVEPAVFSVPAATHAQNIADAFGLPVEDIEVIEGEGEPPDRGPNPIAAPPPPPDLKDEARRRLKARPRGRLRGEDLDDLLTALGWD